ncbi:MAG: YtxH domain-containing protein [Deltaproteobacteria bacterium]|nr:YtxH domain-containing protein [Deltaproteobacteria bacterium]
MAHDRGGDSGFFKGFLFGGVIGAIAALLLAPKTGREMREDISKRSRELKDDIELKLEQAVKRAEDILAENQQKLEQFRNEATAGLKNLEESAQMKYEEGKDAVKGEKGRIKEAIHAGVAAYKDEKESKSDLS